jgi:hypothetical protein
MLCGLVGEGKERGWFVIADSLDSYSLLLLTAQKLRGEAVIACGLGRIIPFSLSCFFLFLEGGKEETMYVHGTGIVDNDYNAAFDSFGHDLYVLCFELSLFLSRWVL